MESEIEEIVRTVEGQGAEGYVVCSERGLTVVRKECPEWAGALVVMLLEKGRQILKDPESVICVRCEDGRQLAIEKVGALVVGVFSRR